MENRTMEKKCEGRSDFENLGTNARQNLEHMRGAALEAPGPTK